MSYTERRSSRISLQFNPEIPRSLVEILLVLSTALNKYQLLPRKTAE